MKYYIGIDIGGMSIKAGIVNESGTLIGKDTCTTRIESGYREIIKDCYDLCQGILKKNKLEKSQVYGVGVGCPGTIWSQEGIITFANNLRFDKVPFVDEFQKYWSIDTYIDNDANCAVLGEFLFGSGKGSDSCICITLGTGVGTGFIIDGKIFRGKRGSGAEAGHMVIKVDSDIECTCGRKGCWEVYASATALIRETKAAMALDKDSLMHQLANKRGKVSGRTAFDAAKLGDNTAKKVVDRYVQYIGSGIVNLVNIFRPDKVLIGGGVSNEGKYLIDMIQDYVGCYHYGGEINPRAEIIKASLMNDAGIIGAAALAMRKGK